MAEFDFFQSFAGPRNNINDVFFDPATQAFGRAQAAGEKQRGLELAAQKQQETRDIFNRLAEGPPDEEETQLLNDLVLLQGVQFATAIRQNIDRANTQEREAFQKSNAQSFKMVTTIIDEKNEGKRDVLVKAFINDKRSRGEPVNRLLSLKGKSIDEQDAILRPIQVTTEKLGEVFKRRQARFESQLKRKEEAAKQKDQFVPLFNGAREVVAQINTRTGEVKTSPLAVDNVSDVKPPVTREFKEGDKIITKQFNPETGEFEPIAEADRFRDEIETTAVRNVRASGIDPDSVEGKEMILQLTTNPNKRVVSGQDKEGNAVFGVVDLSRLGKPDAFTPVGEKPDKQGAKLSEQQKFELRESKVRTTSLRETVKNLIQRVKFDPSVAGLFGAGKRGLEFFTKLLGGTNAPATQFKKDLQLLRARITPLILGETKGTSDAERKLVKDLVEGDQVFSTAGDAIIALQTLDKILEQNEDLFANPTGQFIDKPSSEKTDDELRKSLGIQ